MSPKPLPTSMEKNFAAIFVDELFAAPTYTYEELPCTKDKEVGSSNDSQKGTSIEAEISMDMQKKKHVSTKEENGVRKALDETELPRKRNERENSSNISAAAAWKEIRKACNSLPHIRGVDERAEDFISKFKREMKLEREKSLVEFQEMLARGV